MSDLRAVLQLPDGTCHIVIPTPQALEIMTMDEIVTKSNPENYPYVLVRDEDIPDFSIYRDAWTYDSDKESLVVDIDKAKEMKKDELRAARQPMLAALDTEYMRALEQNADTSEIITKKQVLRDITAIELPDDASELYHFVPDELKGE